MHQSLIIVDDFFNAPLGVRDRTPSQSVLQDHGFFSFAELLQQDGRDPGCWDHIMTVSMRFNRLVSYCSWMWHAAADAFGRSKMDAHLVYLVLFASASGAARGNNGAARA